MSFHGNTFNNGVYGVRPGCTGKTGNSTGCYNAAGCYNATCDTNTTAHTTNTTYTTYTTTRGSHYSTQDFLQCQDLYQ